MRSCRDEIAELIELHEKTDDEVPTKAPKRIRWRLSSAVPWLWQVEDIDSGEVIGRFMTTEALDMWLRRPVSVADGATRYYK